jgi:hypothetical protein
VGGTPLWEGPSVAGFCVLESFGRRWWLVEDGKSAKTRPMVALRRRGGSFHPAQEGGTGRGGFDGGGVRRGQLFDELNSSRATEEP